jgi:hypothetical protein
MALWSAPFTISFSGVVNESNEDIWPNKKINMEAGE